MRKHKKRIYKLLTLACALLISAISYAIYDVSKTSKLQNSTVQFSKCTDGDTARFKIDGVDTSVRFLAIDTPETRHPSKGVEPFGPEASEYTCNAIKKAKSITLEYEPDNLTDKYDRTLAWVFVDGQLLQELLVGEGLAKVDYIYGNYSYTGDLLVAQSFAEYEKRGVWK